MATPRGLFKIFDGTLPVFTSELPIPIKPEWFSTQDDNIAFFKAIEACPPGGTIVLENRSYNIYNGAPITPREFISKSNFKIEGAGMPAFKSDGTGLESSTGTIIIGPLLFVRPVEVTVRNLGIDSGSAVINKFFGGIAQEGFVMANSDHVPVKTNYGKNVLVENISAITQNSTALVHSFLFEGLDNSAARNIKVRNGIHGFVIKATNSYVENVEVIGAGANGMYVLSGDYAQCSNTKIKNVKISNGGGLHIYGYLAPVEGIVVSDITIENALAAGILLEAGPSTLKNVLIENVLVSGAVADGIAVHGGELSVLNATIKNSSGFGIKNAGGRVSVDNVIYKNNLSGDNSGIISSNSGSQSYAK